MKIKNGLYVISYNGDYSETDTKRFWESEAKFGLHEFLFDKIVEAAKRNLPEIPVFRFEYGSVVKIKQEYFIDYIPYAISYFETTEQYEKCSTLLNILNTIQGE